MYLLFLIGEKEYYERQFATLRSFEEVDSLDVSNGSDEDDQDSEERRQQERAMQISNIANIVLLAFKVIHHSYSFVMVKKILEMIWRGLKSFI